MVTFLQYYWQSIQQSFANQESTENWKEKNSKHLIGSRKNGPLFLSNQGQPVSLRLVNHIIEKVGERANVENPHPGRRHLNPHIFRHSIARFLKSKGFAAEWIQNFLGHESFKTTMDMYGTLSIDEMQEIALRKLGE